jgi:chromosome segregation ATPase
MSSLFKNLLGNRSGESDPAGEMRAMLEAMQQERTRLEALLTRAHTASETLQQLGDPIAKLGGEAEVVASRVGEIERTFESLSRIAAQYETLEQRATALAAGQQAAETHIAESLEQSQAIRDSFEEIGGKIDRAVNLKDQLTSFLEIERPFQQLRDEAGSLRSQVEGTGEHIGRLREQHERLLDAHKTAMAKMEAMDRRRDELGRDLQDKERRVVGVEQSVRDVDGVQQTLADVRREIGSVKAMADLVAQKSATLEAQREAVERALAQSENLDRAMRQLDAGVRQQQENERALAGVQEHLVAARALH